MYYTGSHEWVKPQEKIAFVGVSNWAQKELGEVVFIQLPEIGAQLQNGDLACVLESTKAAADIYTPLSGEIIEVNNQLTTNPSLINAHPETKGWVFKIEMQDPSELDDLMSYDVYYKLVMG